MRQKTIILCCFISILSLSLFAQHPSHPFPDNIIDAINRADKKTGITSSPSINTPIPEEERLLAIHSKFWMPELNGWEDRDSSQYFYNSEGKIDIIVRYTWLDNSWLPNQRLVFTYYNNGLPKEEATESWDGTEWGIAEGNTKINYTFNASDQLTTYEYDRWENGAYQDFYRLDFEYHENTNLLSSEIFQYALVSGQLENENRLLYLEYNEVEKPALIIRQTWTDNENWADYSRSVYEYSNNGTTVYVLNQVPEGSEWKDNTRKINTLNVYENIITSLDQSWYEDGQLWIGLYRNTYEYDEYGNRAYNLFEIWNEGIQEWEKTAQNFSTHTPENNIKTNHGQFWSPEINDWENTLFQTLYYELYTVETKDIFLVPVAVMAYPNPSSDLLIVALNEDFFDGQRVQISIFNADGQMIRQAYTHPSQLKMNFDVRGLSTGVYLLQVIQGKKVYTQKVLVAQ